MALKVTSRGAGVVLNQRLGPPLQPDLRPPLLNQSRS
jgi:hypothetical protein